MLFHSSCLGTIDSWSYKSCKFKSRRGGGRSGHKLIQQGQSSKSCRRLLA